MARRVQVQYNPPTPDLQPVAAPQSRPFAPRLAPEVLLPVKELAGLSETLSRITVQQAEDQAKVKRQEGLDAAAAAGPDVLEALRQAGSDQDTAEGKQKANQQAFTDLVKAGKIHVSQDPWAHVGFVQGMSHRLMAGYDAKLNARLAETTATQDANGNPVLAKDPDAVAQEVWSEYKDNPFFANYYGGQIAQQMKGESDAKFASNSARVLGENRVKDTVTWYQNVVTDKLFGMNKAGQAPTADTWAQIKSMGDELYQKTGGLVDRRAAMMDAVKGAGARIDGDDPDGAGATSRAADFYRQMRDAPSGSTTLGKDATTAPELEALIKRADDAHTTKAEKAGHDEAVADKNAIDKGEREYFAAVDEAAKNGVVDRISIMRTYLDEHGDQFGTRRGLVGNYLERAAINANNQAGALEASVLSRELEAGHNPDTVMTTARSLYGSGGMSEPAYKALQNDAESRRSIRPLIEDSPVSRSRHRELEEAAKLPGVPESQRNEIGVEIAAQNQGLVDEFNAREAEAMKGVAALPKEQQDAAQRAWLDKNVPVLKKQLTENGAKFAKEKADAVSEVRQLISRSSSPEQVLTEKASLFSPDQIEFYRAKGIEATNREPMLSSAGYQSQERFLVQKMEEDLANEPDKADRIETAKRELKDQFLAAVGEKLPTTEPSQQDALIRKTAQEQSVEVLQRAASTRVPRLTEAVKPGAETVPVANELLNNAAADLVSAKNAIKAPDRESFVASIPANGNVNVGQDLKDLQSAYVGGSSVSANHFGFHTVTRDLVENRAFVDARAVVANKALSPKDQAQAVVDMYRFTGLNLEDLSEGKVTIRPTDDWNSRVKLWQEYSRNGAIGTHLGLTAALEKELAEPPVSVPVKGVRINVYTTPLARSEDEFLQFAQTREADLRRIAKENGVAQGDAAFKEFIRIQVGIIKKYSEK